jgi:hypothetical protein
MAIGANASLCTAATQGCEQFDEKNLIFAAITTINRKIPLYTDDKVAY